jgi:hypothetical protein
LSSQFKIVPAESRFLLVATFLVGITNVCAWVEMFSLLPGRQQGVGVGRVGLGPARATQFEYAPAYRKVHTPAFI